MTVDIINSWLLTVSHIRENRVSKTIHISPAPAMQLNTNQCRWAASEAE